MRVIYIYIFISIFYCSNIFAGNKIIIAPESGQELVGMGDSLKVIAYIIPEKKYETTDELEAHIDLSQIKVEDFEVVEVLSKKISENNHDIIEAKFLVLFKKIPSDKTSMMIIGEDTYFIDFKNFEFVKGEESKQQGYIVLDNNFKLGLYWYKYRFIIIVMILIALYFITKYLRIRKVRIKILNTKKNVQAEWQKILKASSERQQFEYVFCNISKCKDDLKNIFENDPRLKDKERVIESFVSSNREYFYQRTWSPEIEEKIKKNFEYIRDIFDGEPRI